MKIYVVGGAVRDRLMGFSPMDVDYVIVGASPADLLAKGFKQVGADFPVFLHPETQDEYALARTERKSGSGYGGFLTETNGVTLEEDLGRRDLTINAMAMDQDCNLIDPYGGKTDLENRVLRHVSASFAEDPLRILRVARFKARFGHSWSVAPETLELMKGMVKAGTLDELVQERVWVEIEKGLSEPFPELMLHLLYALGVFDRASFIEYSGVERADLDALRKAADDKSSVAVCFALGFPRKWDPSELKGSRIPRQVREVCHTFVVGQENGLLRFAALDAEDKVQLLRAMDGFRQTERMAQIAQVLQYVAPEQVSVLQAALAATAAIDKGAIAAACKGPDEIQRRITQAYVEAVKHTV